MAYRKKTFVRPELKCKSGRVAYVFWGKREWYCGPWDGQGVPSAEVMQKYLATCSFLEQQFHAKAQPNVAAPEPERPILIDEGIADYLWWLAHSEEGDLREDGRLSDHYQKAVVHLRPLSALFGDRPAEEFATVDLRTYRQAVRQPVPDWWTAVEGFLDRHPRPAQWSARYTNRAARNIVRFFAWLESQDRIPAGRAKHLEAVEPLRGEPARERGVVPDDAFEETLRYLSPTVAAMARIERLTAMRPEEICTMRPMDIDRARDVWVYRPVRHKQSWRRLVRMVPLGPECQEVLREFMDRDEDAYLFSPAESWQWHQEHPVQRSRKTPVYPSELRQRAAKKAARARRTKKIEPGDHFTPGGYRQAIRRAIGKANKAGASVPHWVPYQLRHTRITEVQDEHGWEDAQAVAGHESADTTRRYAHERHQRAIRLAASLPPRKSPSRGSDQKGA